MNLSATALLSTFLKREIEVFLQVAKSGSMSESAPLLNLNQPAISKSLNRLENELKIPLFSRNRDGVKLTHEGRELQNQLLKWMDQWRVEQEKTMVRHLTIGCHQSLAIEFFPQFVTEIRKFFPGTEFAFRFMTSLQVTEKVADLEIDLGIVVNPIKRRQVISRKVREDYVSYFARPGSEKSPLLVHPDMLYASRIKASSAEVLQIADYEVIAEMVKHGKFVGILPATIARRHGLTQIDRKLFAVDMSLIFHEDRFDRETAKNISKLFS